MADLWHVGERHGDNGLVIRDQNGLTVQRAATKAIARHLVNENNKRELAEHRQQKG